jgi:hypothetical protein
MGLQAILALLPIQATDIQYPSAVVLIVLTVASLAYIVFRIIA